MEGIVAPLAPGRESVEAALKLADARAIEFVGLADRLLNDAYRLAGYLLGSASEAEDAVQEALTRAWQAWPSLRDRDRFEPWFDRILVNICRDRLRKRRGVRLEELDEELPVYTEDPFRAALARAEIDKLVGVLNPDQRVVVALRFWRDLSLQEIANTLGIPLGTVQSRLHYAIQALREAAERQGIADPADTERAATRRPTTGGAAGAAAGAAGAAGGSARQPLGRHDPRGAIDGRIEAKR